MSSSLDCLDLCRLCLIKDRVSVPIFEDEGDVRQIFLKITACLPVKVSRDDKLPKKICDDCVYKVELFYQFWNTTANAEKQLLQWLGEVDLEDKQTYVTEVLDTNVMKQEQNSDNRLEGNVIQVSGHQNNMDIGMIEDMTIMTIPAGSEQQFTTVPMDTSGTVQTVQAVPGPSTHDQMGQSQTHLVTEEVEESEEEENSDDGCDNEEGLPVKEETEEVQTETFVNVPISCDEAGPSGLQQQKVTEMSEMSMTQTATDGDPKTGLRTMDPLGLLKIKSQEVLNTSSEIMTNEKEEQVKSISEKDTILIKTEPEDLNEDSCSNENVDLKKINDKNKIHTCEICNKTFSRRQAKAVHMVMHRTSKPFKCDHCPNKSFKTKNNLRCHMTRVHSDNAKIYSCEKCVFETKLKQNLELHHLNKHSDTYEYPCTLCAKKFKTKRTLKAHMKDHTSGPCVCDTCGKVYPHKNSLYGHKRHMHTDLVKDYKCKHCNKCFMSQKNLNSHRKLHKIKYICEQCGRQYKNQDFLTRHLRTHSTDKHSLCPVCGKSFVSLTSQKIHMLTHIGEKPYVCDICGKSFTQRTPMMLHRRTQHPDIKDPPPPPIKIVTLLKAAEEKVADSNTSSIS